MISDNDRSYWFGASDSQKIINPNHSSKTWQKWWRIKQGTEKPDFIGNVYTEAGTRFEHPILECFDKSINKDRQLFLEDLRLRVNYDGDKDGIIYEVKTHGINKPFEITPYIEAQVQTEIYVWKQCREDFNGLYIISYGLLEEDYRNMNPTVEDIDYDRIKVKEVKYKKGQAKKIIKSLKPLVEELDKMRKPSIMQNEKYCYLSKARNVPLDCHHIFHGYGNRRISDENGFWCYLRRDNEHNYHTANSTEKTPHNDMEIDLFLKRECQKKFEETHSREEFMDLIGRNYLD